MRSQSSLLDDNSDRGRRSGRAHLGFRGFTLGKQKTGRRLSVSGLFWRVGPVGIEPTTHGLKVRCSTN